MSDPETERHAARMKNEMVHACCMTVGVAVVVVGIAWAFAWGYVASWRAVTEAGYSEKAVQNPGATVYIWTKD